MKKEFRKMYLLALGKIIFAVALALITFLVFAYDNDKTSIEGIIICSILWGIVVVIYLFSGIFTITKGSKQAKEYIANSAYNEMQLEEEYNHSQTFGRLHVGTIHAFVNASNGFYILPISEVENMYITHYKSYYHLHIKARNVNRKLKLYYISRKKVYNALDCLQSAVLATAKSSQETY